MEIDVKRLAKLSKLKFSEEDLVRVASEMEKMITMVEKLPDIQGSGSLVDPSNPMVLRRDEAHNDFNREDLLKTAPQVQAGCIVVPRIVE